MTTPRSPALFQVNAVFEAEPRAVSVEMAGAAAG